MGASDPHGPNSMTGKRARSPAAGRFGPAARDVADQRALLERMEKQQRRADGPEGGGGAAAGAARATLQALSHRWTGSPSGSPPPRAGPASPASPAASPAAAKAAAAWRYLATAHGTATSQGAKPAQEDRTAGGFPVGRLGTYFGLFDGHGGELCVDFVHKQLHTAIQHELDARAGALGGPPPAGAAGVLPPVGPAFAQGAEAAIVAAFRALDARYLALARRKFARGGTTALLSFVYGSRPEDAHLVLANLGDCRAVLCRGGRAHALTADQKPGVKAERRAIEQRGGQVVMLGETWRVCTSSSVGYNFQSVMKSFLAVSRAFGDPEFKDPPVVSATPEVDVVALGPEDLFMVLACDGVWDVLTNEEVVDLAARHPGDPRRAAALIVKEAERKQSADNITATVVQFAWNADRAEAVLAKFREAGGHGHGGARAGTPDSELDMFADEGAAGGAGFAGFLGAR